MSVIGEKITEFVGVVLVCGALALGTPPVANADHHGGVVTSVIGKNVVEGTGKVTSITVTEAGPMVNIDATMGERGTAIYTVTFGARWVRQERPDHIAPGAKSFTRTERVRRSRALGRGGRVGSINGSPRRSFC